MLESPFSHHITYDVIMVSDCHRILPIGNEKQLLKNKKF